jgi:hypothetical protein
MWMALASIETFDLKRAKWLDQDVPTKFESAGVRQPVGDATRFVPLFPEDWEVTISLRFPFPLFTQVVHFMPISPI